MKKFLLFILFFCVSKYPLFSFDKFYVDSFGGNAEYRLMTQSVWNNINDKFQIADNGMLVTHKKTELVLKNNSGITLKIAANSVLYFMYEQNNILLKIVSGSVYIDNSSDTDIKVFSVFFSLNAKKNQSVSISVFPELTIINAFSGTFEILDLSERNNYNLKTGESIILADKIENKIFAKFIDYKDASSYFEKNSSQLIGDLPPVQKLTVEFENLNEVPSNKNPYQFKIITDKNNIVKVNNKQHFSKNNVFDITMFLNQGENNIFISVYSENINQKYEKKLVKIFDSIPPKLLINRINFEPNGIFNIEGLSEPGATVYVAHIPIKVNDNGSFSAAIRNIFSYIDASIIDIKSIDKAGNENIYKSNLTQINDYTAPELISAELSANNIPQNSSVMLTVIAKDKSLLMSNCSVKLKNPSGVSIEHKLNLSGNAYKGFLSGTLTAVKGQYIIEKVKLSDFYNNRAEYPLNLIYTVE